MPTPCVKEQIITTLIQGQNETSKQLGILADHQNDQISKLIQIETLLNTLIKYQLSENSDKIKELDIRLTKIEALSWKMVAWASVGGAIGGFIFQLFNQYVIIK